MARYRWENVAAAVLQLYQTLLNRPADLLPAT
jgi:hypothetical protein